MSLKAVWSDNYHIGAYDTNMNANIKLGKLTGYIQETAGMHANHLGFGREFIHKTGMSWVLSGIKIHLDSIPKWEESYTVETWTKGMDRLYFLRDFVLYDKDGECFGYAATQWLLIDMKSKRPKLMDNDVISQVADKERNVFEQGIEKLPRIEKGETTIRNIDYTDFDLNQHVNSNRYVDFILGLFPVEFHTKHKVSDFQLNFIKEIKESGEIILVKKQIGDEKMFLVEGLSKRGKVVHFQSFVSFV